MSEVRGTLGFLLLCGATVSGHWRCVGGIEEKHKRKSLRIRLCVGIWQDRTGQDRMEKDRAWQGRKRQD